MSQTPKGPFDFGEHTEFGPDIPLLHVKRVRKDVRSSNIFKDFGVFLGCQQGKWAIGIRDLCCNIIISYERFETIEALKKEWQLDQEEEMPKLTIQITDEEARLLANLINDERDTLEDCGCKACKEVLPKSDRLWSLLKNHADPFSKTDHRS